MIDSYLVWIVVCVHNILWVETRKTTNTYKHKDKERNKCNPVGRDYKREKKKRKKERKERKGKERKGKERKAWR